MKAGRLADLVVVLLLSSACGAPGLPDHERVRADLENHPINQGDHEHKPGELGTITSLEIEEPVSRDSLVSYQVEVVYLPALKPDAPADSEVPKILYDAVLVYELVRRDWELQAIRVTSARLLETPNMASRSKSISTLKNIGVVVLSFLGDAHRGAPEVSSSGHEIARRLLDDTPSEDSPWSYEAMRDLLHPSEDFYYMGEVPRYDGWGHPIEFWMDSRRFPDYVVLLRSPGEDGLFESGSYADGYTTPDGFNTDVVWVAKRSGSSNGILETRPE